MKIMEDKNMATEWKSQITEADYRLQFETSNDYYYKMVEKACQRAVDMKDRGVEEAHWIDGADSFGAMRGKYRVCSYCDMCIPNSVEVNDYHWQYCPNCGSLMKWVRK